MEENIVNVLLEIAKVDESNKVRDVRTFKGVVYVNKSEMIELLSEYNSREKGFPDFEYIQGNETCVS